MLSLVDDRGWQGARLTRLAEVMDANPGAYWVRQYENPDDPASYAPLAGELAADLDRIDILVGAVGSGGSLCGTSRALRKLMPDLYTVGVDAVGSVIFDQPDTPGRRQSGLGNSLHPPNVDRSTIDEVHWLNDHEAFAATRELADEQKLFYGNTSGSVYKVLRGLAARTRPGTRIVGIFADRGDRYIETVYSDPYWDECKLKAEPVARRPRQVAPATPVSGWSYAVLNERRRARTFVFIESNTTGSGMLALRRARSLGFEPVLVTSDPGRYHGLESVAPRIVDCDTNDLSALRATLNAEFDRGAIAGVSTTSEFYLDAAASLSADLGLPGDNPGAVATCRDKAALREALRKAGVLQPDYEVITDPGQVDAAFTRLGPPCVVKPVNDSGSTDVLRCETVEDARRQAARILARTTNGRGQSAARKVLVEELLDHPEYSLEMFGADGVHSLVAAVEKTCGEPPHFVERRHILPAPLPEPVIAGMAAMVRRALVAAGVSHGATHTEVKLTPDGPAIIEINPRLAGGMIPELIRLATGVDLIECQLKSAAGAEYALPDRMDGCAGIEFLLQSGHGVVEEIRGLDEARSVPGVVDVRITADRGTRVGPAVDAYGRVGWVMARGDTRAEVAAALSAARDSVEIVLGADGREPAGTR